MGKRRADNPMTILVIGILALCSFGVMVVFVNQKTPILQLRPLLRETYDEPKIQTKLHPSKGGEPPYIVVQVPSGGELTSAAKRWEIGAFALTKYRELANDKTGVRVAWVQIEEDETTRLRVPLAVVQAVAALDKPEEQASLRKRIADLGCKDVEITVIGPAKAGAHIRVKAMVSEQRKLEWMQRKLHRILRGLRHVTLYDIVLHSTDGKQLRDTGGRDAPRKPGAKKPTKNTKPKRKRAAKPE